MGRVRTKTVKKSSRQVIERYYGKMTLDFHTNKKILEEVAIIPSKRLRNKIAGFSTHLMKRIQKGPVRGISLKLQEEERERRMDFVPDESAIKTDRIEFPWSRLGQDPVLVSLDHIFLLAEPATMIEGSSEDSVQEVKKSRIRELEKKLLRESTQLNSEMICPELHI